MSQVKDEALYNWLQMIILGKNGVGFFKGIAKKECVKLLKGLAIEDGAIDSDRYDWLYEKADSYIKSCLESPSYASSIMGLKHADKNEKQIFLANDIKLGAQVYLQGLGFKKESEALLSLFKEAYLSNVSDGEEIWNRVMSQS